MFGLKKLALLFSRWGFWDVCAKLRMCRRGDPGELTEVLTKKLTDGMKARMDRIVQDAFAAVDDDGRELSMWEGRG